MAESDHVDKKCTTTHCPINGMRGDQKDILQWLEL